jgi:hypothetical protein
LDYLVILQKGKSLLIGGLQHFNTRRFSVFIIIAQIATGQQFKYRSTTVTTKIVVVGFYQIIATDVTTMVTKNCGS